MTLPASVPRRAPPVRARDTHDTRLDEVAEPTPAAADTGRRSVRSSVDPGSSREARGPPRYTATTTGGATDRAAPSAADADAVAAPTDAAGAARGDTRRAGAAAAGGVAGGAGGGATEGRAGLAVLADDARDPYEVRIEDLITVAELESPPMDLPPEAEPLQFLPLVPLPTTRVEWGVASTLADDAIVFPVVPKRPDDPKASDQSADNESKGVARRGYAAFANEAARAQGELTAEVRRTTEAMGNLYREMSQDTLDRLSDNLRDLELARGQAQFEVDRNADAADGALEISYLNAVAQTQISSRRAHGRIAANYRTADTQIETILTTLSAGHVAVFQTAIAQERVGAITAAAMIDEWVGRRVTTYPALWGLAGAKNEERQRVIPRLAQVEKDQMNSHKDRTIREWDRSQRSTVRNIRCSYRCPLDQHKQAINTEGHAQVSRTLATSLDTLRRQTREGRAALAMARVGARGQVEAQARAGREKLNGEARATLAGTQREVMAAQRGVQSAGESTAPAFPRMVQRLEDLIRRAAQRGALAATQVARTSPGEMSRSLANLRSTNLERLAANGLRLSRSLAERRNNGERAGRNQTAESSRDLEHSVAETGPAMMQSAAEMALGFDELAREIARAADSWAEPFETQFAGMLRQARTDLGTQLAALLSGAGNDHEEEPHTSMALPEEGEAAAPAAPECGPCTEPEVEDPEPNPDADLVDPYADTPDVAVNPDTGLTADGEVPPLTEAGPRGLTAQIDGEADYFTERANPDDYFRPTLANTDEQMRSGLHLKTEAISHGFEAGFWDPVDEGAITGALRGVTRMQGSGLEDLWVTESDRSGTLRGQLRRYLCPFTFETEDYKAAIDYLNGDVESGAAHELRASIGFFNDDEARIENIMGSLSPTQLATMRREHGETLDYIEGYLGGTDLEVFQALRQAEYGVASSLRLADEVMEARFDKDLDAADTAIATRTSSTTYSGWNHALEEQMNAANVPDAERAEWVRNTISGEVLGSLATRVQDVDVAYAAGAGGVGAMTDQQRALAFLTRPVDIDLGPGHGTLHFRYEGAHRDFADAAMRHGPDSPEARAARFGIEMERGAAGDEPRPINILTATRDPRFVEITPEMPRAARMAALREMREARADREEMIRLASTRYGTGREGDTADSMREGLESQLGDYMEDEDGREFMRGIIHDERPSPTTVARGMAFAMYSHRGTDEDLLFDLAEHMNRDEIEATRTAFAQMTRSTFFPNGRSLDAELGVYDEPGVYGEGNSGELSGDDRLRMERAMMGQPRNDRERFETAMFALQQQRNETGFMGRGLASGSFADRALAATEARLLGAVGGSATFDRHGRLIGGEAVTAFTGRGRLRAESREDFMVYSGIAQTVAQNYSARIDTIASAFSTIVAVLGAIAAAALTIVTFGAATPVLVGTMMACAALTGAVQMGLSYAIKGGRYGWEQALTDLGMTAIQVVTAGIGASLGASARVAQGAYAAARAAGQAASVARAGLSGMARIFTGSPIVNQIMIGSVTGAIGGLGNTALDPNTWKGGAGDVLGNLVGGTVRGTAGGAATGLVSGVLEHVPIRGIPMSERMQGMNIVSRSLVRGTISAAGGMAGRAAEIGVDRARRRYRGDFGDALLEIGAAGAQSFATGAGETFGEAAGGRFAAWRDARRAAVVQRAMTEHEEQARGRALMGETPDPSVRPLLAAEAAGMPPEAAAALADTVTRPGRGASTDPVAPDAVAARARLAHAADDDDADPATPRARDGHGDAPDPAAPRRFGDGTASAVDESFHGAAETPGSSGAARLRDVKRALRSLLGTGAGEFGGGAVTMRGRDPTRLSLETPNGRVDVRVRLADGPLPPMADGTTPVAQFRRVGDGYEITVSGGASRRHVERALAHELAEIRAGHGTDVGGDVLRPRGPAVGVDEEGRPRLSPHDEGRLAELRVIARRIAGTRDHAELAALGRDLAGLAAHLGLSGSDANSAARLRVALGVMGEDSLAARALAGLVERQNARGAHADTLDERVRMTGGPGSEYEDLPGAPPAALARRPGEDAAVGDRFVVPGNVKAWMRARARGESGAELAAALGGEGPHNERTSMMLGRLTNDQLAHVLDTGRLPPGVEFHHAPAIGDSPHDAHTARSGVGLSRDDHMDAHDDNTRIPGGALTPRVDEPDMGAHPDRRAAPRARVRPTEVAAGDDSFGDIDRDLARQHRADARRFDAAADTADAVATRARAQLAEEHARGNDASADRAEARLDRAEALAARLRAMANGARASADLAEAAMAARATGGGGDDGGPLPAGTAAAVRGSRFRGDFEPTPRPHSGLLDEVATAIARLTSPGGIVADAQGVRLPDGSTLITMRPPSGEGPDIVVRVVASDTLPAGPDGVPVARFRPDPDNPGQYIIEMSSRAPVGSARRALAHELTEIRHAHADRISHDDNANLLRSGGFGAEGRTDGANPRLTPHDRGRLAEIEVLAQDLAAARAAGDETGAARIRDEAQRLLAHLGVIDESPGGRARLALASDALADRPALVRDFLATESAAAREHPFLRPMPADSEGRMNLILDRLGHARAMGDAELVARVFQQARGLITFNQAGNVEIAGTGPVRRISAAWLERLGPTANARLLMLAELAGAVRGGRFEYRNTSFGRRPVDPAQVDPELVAATMRRYGDIEGAQTWEQFRLARFRRGSLPTIDEINAAFYEWASGRIVDANGRVVSLVAPNGLPRTRAQLGAVELVTAARIAGGDDIGGDTAEGTPRSAQDAIDARRNAMAEAETLRKRIPHVTDPEELARIDDRLRELIPEINNPTRDLGEAAGTRVARELFGATDDNLQMFSGSNVPDIVVDSTNPDRLVIIEAKGADAPLGYRRSRDGTRMVQQGTYEYLDSLAASMQQPPGNPNAALGRRIEAALRTGRPPLEYALVRQPIPATGDLPSPEVRHFIIRKP